MNLKGSLSKLLKGGSVFYRERARLFDHNSVVRDAWLQFAMDLEQQVAGLRELPPAFWREMEPFERRLMENVRACLTLLPHGSDEAPSLQSVIARTLSCEEPVILQIHVPLIRKLRTSWTDRSLDFYVIVKAHVTHLSRLIETYCGDPILSRRAAALMESFEKEVQEPEAITARKARQSARAQRARKSAMRARRRSHPHRALKSPSKARARPAAKPAVRKIALGRRRASR